MILGDVCTRACRYCSVTSGKPHSLPDTNEPEHVAEAVHRLGLNHAVVTSVDRDDLLGLRRRPFCCHHPGDSSPPAWLSYRGVDPKILWAMPKLCSNCYKRNPKCSITTPKPCHVCFKRMRSKGVYKRTLEVLARADAHRQANGIAMTTKSGVMVGLK